MAKKNKIFYVAVFMLILSLGLFLFTLYIKSSIVLEKREIIATLQVGNIAGFDANATALTFGTITSGSVSSRNLTIENNYKFPIKVEFSTKGNITEFLIFEEVIYLDVAEKKPVKIRTISAIDNIDKKYGNYFGKMIIVIKKDI